jgi:hypothetical protein
MKRLKANNREQFNTCQKASEYNSDETWNVFNVKCVTGSENTINFLGSQVRGYIVQALK